MLLANSSNKLNAVVSVFISVSKNSLKYE